MNYIQNYLPIAISNIKLQNSIYIKKSWQLHIQDIQGQHQNFQQQLNLL